VYGIFMYECVEKECCMQHHRYQGCFSVGSFAVLNTSLSAVLCKYLEDTFQKYSEDTFRKILLC